MKTALYSGSFDPATFGHMDIILRAARAFERLVVAVGVHHAKASAFSPLERVAILEQLVAPIASDTGCRIEVVQFDGLVVEAARKAGAGVIVRGLRNAADFDYEGQMAGMNGAIAPDVDTMFFAASGPVRHIASSLVRQIAAMGGDVSAFVPPLVAERLHTYYQTV